MLIILTEKTHKTAFSMQVVLTISQLMWCREMENCLEGDHNHFEALQEFERTNIEVTPWLK